MGIARGAYAWTALAAKRTRHRGTCADRAALCSLPGGIRQPRPRRREGLARRRKSRATSVSYWRVTPSQLLTTSNTPNCARAVMVAKANVLGPSRKWRPMTLLDEVIEAGGGMARWNSLKRFTLQLSIDGALFSRVGQAGRFREMVAEGSTRNPSVRFTGFADPAKCGLYQPDCVTIESPEGTVLRAWRNPHQAFRDQPAEALWDELYLVFFCGFSVWNYLTTPFLLAHPDIAVEELAPWHERDQVWRRLRAVFPADFVTHCAEQTFYFDENG